MDGSNKVAAMTIVLEEFNVVLLAIILVSGVSCRSNALTDKPMSVENSLRALNGNEMPKDLSISYDDMHGLWGGTSIIIRGDGKGERRERARGNAEPEVFETNVSQQQLLELIRLLLKNEAWKQKTPEREPVPDESRATLTVSVGGQTSSVWEWFNEMNKNDRLIQIKTKMTEITK